MGEDQGEGEAGDPIGGPDEGDGYLVHYGPELVRQEFSCFDNGTEEIP